tara:strand:+ start:5967 stop:6551 length:585 start_codon:yes stop_codon:yes gene_type:complete
MNDRLKKVAQEKGLIKGMGVQLSRLSGVDKSTVSAHLTGTKKLSMYHAEKYAQGLEVPVVKILDESVIKYPIVGYVSDLGHVRMRAEHETDICIAENELVSTDCFALYQQLQETIFFYNPKKSCKNTDIINSYCYIKSEQHNFLGTIIKENKKYSEVYNVHEAKIKKVAFDICYPIISINYIKHANIYKIKNSI